MKKIKQENKRSWLPGAAGVQAHRGFTLVELIVVIAIIGVLSSSVLALLSSAQREAKDKRRISDLQQLQRALELYSVDYQGFPKESEGANGNTATNEIFRALIKPYLQGTALDPINNGTFYYYYDGSHQCGSGLFAVIFARQMENPENSNYNDFLNTTCGTLLDGEGRGGGEESYNIKLGRSSG